MAKDNINGVAYNTKTAEAIARNGSGREISHSDERWFNETLYRKKTGEFFLYGSGGIFTKYAKQTGPNSWERSEAILPLTENEVREWAMNNLGDAGYRDICQKIGEKPVPVIKEKRQYTRRNSVIDLDKVETVINIIKKNPSISQLDLAQKAGFSKSTIVIIMDSLKKSGRLTRVGSRRKGQWVVDGILKETEPQIAEAKKPVITVYGTHTCPDCSFIEDQIKDEDGFRFVDIGLHVKNLKAFMALRDSDPVFDSVRNKGIGIPVFVHEDGTVTLVPEDVGLKSREEALLEKQRREEAQEAAKKSSAKTAAAAKTDTARDANTKKIIRMIKENPSVSQSDFQKATDLSRMQVVTILNHLKEDGKIEHTGSRRAGQWVLK